MKKKPPDPYKTIKNNLSNVVTDERTLRIINDSVIRMDKISTHTYQFMKMYLLHERETMGKFPTIDHNLIMNVMKTVCITPTVSGRPPKHETVILKRKLKEFYNSHYKPTIAPGDEPQSYRHLNYVFEYTATAILTDYQNNIKLNYYKYVQRYVYNRLGYKTVRPTLSKEERSSYDYALRQVRNDVLSVCGEPMKSSLDYSQSVSDFKKICLPAKYATTVIDKFTKERLEHHKTSYDVCVNPNDYLEPMYLMMLGIEEEGVKVYNLFPQCSSQVPRHITIDTSTVYHLLMDATLHPAKPSYISKFSQYESEIWSPFFMTTMRCFKRGSYSFNYMISTDGVSVSIQLIHGRYKGMKVKATEIAIRKETANDPKETANDPKEKKHEGFYITDLADPESLTGKTVVGIDPGKSDLLYAITVSTNPSCRRKKNATKLRYTQNQRRTEQQIKKHRNLILKWKKESRIEGKTVVEWESSLAHDLETGIRHPFNSKSLQSSEYQKYLCLKNLITHKLSSFYHDPIYRKFRLNTYSNTQRSESNFMNRFRETFGHHDNVVVGFGDWSEHGHRKGHEPLKGVGFHKMIRNAGYEVFLVNEHRTSKTCSNCKDGSCECEYARKCNNPRPWKREEVIDRHGLIICQRCKTLWNRDVNASLNIHDIMKETIAGRGRPSYFLKPKVAELPSS